MDDPKAASIFVALDRVRLCYPEQAHITWTGRSKRTCSSEPDSVSMHSTPHICSGPVTDSCEYKLNSELVEIDSCSFSMYIIDFCKPLPILS